MLARFLNSNNQTYYINNINYITNISKILIKNANCISIGLGSVGPIKCPKDSLSEIIKLNSKSSISMLIKLINLLLEYKITPKSTIATILNNYDFYII